MINKDPNEKLSSKQIADEFFLNQSTLRGWRRCRTFDKRYPRYHKLFTGKVFYVRSEFEEDYHKMELETGRMEMAI